MALTANRGDVVLGEDILGQHAVQRRGHRHRLGSKGEGGSVHPGAGLVERQKFGHSGHSPDLVPVGC